MIDQGLINNSNKHQRPLNRKSVFTWLKSSIFMVMICLIGLAWYQHIGASEAQATPLSTPDQVTLAEPGDSSSKITKRTSKRLLRIPYRGKRFTTCR